MTNQNHSVIFFDLSNSRNAESFSSLMKERSPLILNPIENLLKELFICRFPKYKYDERSVEDLVHEHLKGQNIDEYGLWIYYPWKNCIVHTLPEDEFIELRTSRNIYKITKEERINLSGKVIGVIGLSVGKSIATTVAMERICGELKLADFDVIEMSNLNRLQGGITNIGLLKTVLTAREIAEIDPFIKVTCFHEGISENNIDAFLNQNKLDLLVEECDDLYVKLLSRLKSKEYKIPVVMHTSDSGMVDIERFDTEINYDVFHGKLNDLSCDIQNRSEVNHHKKIILEQMIDFENLSLEMKKSFEEIGKTINSWPQLASDVIAGAGMVTQIAREIMLKKTIESGRYFHTLIKK